jgi:hypothetical protein
MKGFVLCVAVGLGILVSNFVIAQEVSAPQPPTPVVIDGSVTPEATATTSSGECCCKPTLVGMSRTAVQKAVSRGRSTVRTLWSKRPHLRRCCRC